MPQVSFSSVHDNRIRTIFTETCDKYPQLQEVNLVLKQAPIKGSTMQAQPVFTLRSLAAGLDTYRIRLAIYVRDSADLRVDELSDEILVGWFAHELGHVIDYMSRSSLQMIGYGVKYLTSSRFRRSVEHRADEIAITNGFYNQILAAKRFLFNHEMIDEKYREKMKRFYMSIEDAERWMQKNIDIDPIA